MVDISVVVLAFGPEPYLTRCVDSVLASEGCRVELVLVDNGCTSGAVAEVAAREGVVVIRPGRNLGYSGGCNLAVSRSTSPILAFVNSDAEVDPRCLANLAAELADPGIGIVQASIRLADSPDHINTAGNPVHVLGFAWAGGLGEPVSSHAAPRDVASASGACMAVTRATWTALGAFDDEYFAYHEDVDLSLRCWISGRRVRFCAGAVARHHYEFSRNSDKMYLLERNRLITVLSTWQRRTLVLLAPSIAAVELLMLVVAARGGFTRAKLRSWWWLLRHLAWLRRRRHRVQSLRRVPDARVWPMLATTFEPSAFPVPAWVASGERLARPYWQLVARAVARGPRPAD